MGIKEKIGALAVWARGHRRVIAAVTAIALACAIAAGCLACCTGSSRQTTGSLVPLTGTTDFDSAFPALERQGAEEGAVHSADGEAKGPDAAGSDTGSNSQKSGEIHDGGSAAESSNPPSQPSTRASASDAGAGTTPSGTHEGSDGEQQGSSDPDPGGSAKRWVVDYAQVWVEDSAAWTEQVPVYGIVERSVCNVCGADVTGFEAAHAKEHMMAGQGGGHHSETSQVVTGYDVVELPATGHWETVESGGHWE